MVRLFLTQPTPWFTPLSKPSLAAQVFSEKDLLKYLTILSAKAFLILGGMRIPFSLESMKDQIETSHTGKKNSLTTCLNPFEI
jgi:hypothetical protein